MNRIKRWSSRVAKLFDDKEILGKTWDCSVLVGGHAFKAHRWILAAQSPALHALIAAQKEKPIALVAINTSYPVQAVESVIHYCYHGYIDEATLKGEGAEAIYDLAHDYGMIDLKESAEEGLTRTVNKETIAQRVRFADKYASEKVMRACIWFIDRNKSWLESPEWTALKRESPKMIAKLLMRVEKWSGTRPTKYLSTCRENENVYRKAMMVKRNRSISQLYAAQDTADCQIQVGGEVISAHKCLLMAHSPAFLEMFSNSASPKAETGVVIEKSIPNPAAVRELIRYCYQGGLPNWTMDRVELEVPVFQLADKYCVYGMKDKLERSLINGLSNDNMDEEAALADTYFAHNLKKACTNRLSSMLNDALVLDE